MTESTVEALMNSSVQYLCPSSVELMFRVFFFSFFDGLYLFVELLVLFMHCLPNFFTLSVCSYSPQISLRLF